MDKNEKKCTKFVLEPVTPTLSVLYGIEEVLCSKRTKFQSVDLVRTPDYGLALLLDGLIQSSEFDEFIYHECLVHPTMLSHPNPKRVLVIGGGEGATVREVAKHRQVERIEMVDIDGELVELAKKQIPWSEGFSDPRLELVVSEGASYLSSQPRGKYDVIVMDATDPEEEGLAMQLYTEDFYRMAAERLSDSGLLVTHCPSFLFKPKLVFTVREGLDRAFARTSLYAVYVKSLHGMWSFIVGSKGRTPDQLSGQEVDVLLKERGVEGLRFYSGKVHEAIFTLSEAYLKLVRA